MVRFISKLRHSLINENRFSKYLLYAIGEIVLVVIGILIALQINNWNDQRKMKKVIETYRHSLIAELQNDIKQIEAIESLIKKDMALLENYISYYNSPHPDINILVQKLDSINYEYYKFSTEAHTIEEIITSGNLTLFSSNEKNAILELRTTHIEMDEYYKQNVSDLLNYTKAVNQEIDVLYLYGYSKKENPEIANWKYNIRSKAFRLYNNEIAGVIFFFNSSKENNNTIKRHSNILIKLLNDNLD